MRCAPFVCLLLFAFVFAGQSAVWAEDCEPAAKPPVPKKPVVKAPDPAILTLKDLYGGGRTFTKPILAWRWRPGHAELVRLDVRKVKVRKGRGRPTAESKPKKDKGPKAPPPKPVIVAMDPGTGAVRDLLDLSSLAALVPDPAPDKDGKPVKKKVRAMRGVGRAGAKRFTWSKDGTKLCVVVKGDLVWVDLASGARRRLTHTQTPMADLNIAPDASHVSFSRANELWVVATKEGKPRALTSGSSKTLLNGTLDWVYPEELGHRTAAWWSPDSKQIAYLQMDQSGVPVYRVPGILPLRSPGREMFYPKAGDPNPKARVGVVSVEGGETRWVGGVPCESYPFTMEYVVRVGWQRDFEAKDSLKASPWVMTSDRTQRRYALFVDGADKDVWQWQIGWGWGWPAPKPRVVDYGTTLWQREQDGRQWFRETSIESTPHEERSVQLTAAWQDAGKLLHFDPKTWRVIYPATPRGSHTPGVFVGGPGTKTLVRAPFATDPKLATTASIDESGTYALVTTQSATTPPRTVLAKVADGELIREIGSAHSEKLDDLELAVPEYGAIPQGEHGKICWRLWKPHDFDPKKKYGLIVHTYGGPGSRMVRNTWGRGPLMATMLCQRGFLVLQADGRGTAGQGDDWLFSVKEKLGILEIDDQATAVKHILKRGYVDPERVGIWGWSYGGTMACNALTMRGDVFKVGVAVAPVTDWRLYDSIYTERYMGLPEDNPEGYKQSSSITHAKKMKGHLLLMHGLADDNVHAQNTLRLVEAFIKAKVTTYDVMLYPKRAHGIGGAGLDVFTRLVGYFERHMGE